MEYEEAKDKAIRYLALSKKTEYEVFNKLVKLDVDTHTISNVISYLKEIKYIDDNDYIDSYIRQNEKMLKYSIYEISQKLKNKGVESELIDKKMQQLIDKNYEKDIIDKIINNKSKNMDEFKVKQYLFRRGFKSI